MDWWTIGALVLGTAFGGWSHWTSGSGGWSDAFLRREERQD